MTMLPGWIENILAAERNSVHFEDFSIAVMNAEGKNFLPTSRNYDLGRDGRKAATDFSGRIDVLCVSLEKNVVAKARNDATRLNKTSKVRNLCFCTVYELTEHAGAEIETAIREKLSEVVDVEVFGMTQLIHLSMRHEEVFQQYYYAEIDALKKALQPTPTNGAEEQALRLALMTQTGDDAAQLRQKLANRLVLEHLLQAGPQSNNEIATAIGQQLRLPTSPSVAYVSQVVNGLEADGRINWLDGKAAVTDAGKSFVREMPEDASATLLEGREVVHEAIRQLSGHTLQADEYNRFWKRFQDGLASAFYLHATTIVSMVAALENGNLELEPAEARTIRNQLADVATAEMTSQTQKAEVRQAVVDMFSEKEMPAFKWLSSVCAVFVMLCSLGLEAKSAGETAGVLRKITLLTDTDILLSLLCDAEPNHEETKEILKAWQSLRGKVAIPIPALEEAAYHAWSATKEYTASVTILAKLDDVQADHVLNNAFVRSFRKLAGTRTGRNYWNSYIQSFRGTAKHDYSALVAYIKTELQIDVFEVAPNALDRTEGSFYNRVQRFMIRDRASELGKGTDELDHKTVDKCRRDAVSLSLIHASRKGKLGGVTTPIIISSAGLVKRADVAFRAELGEPESVIQLSAVAVLLTLVPGVSMTLGTLKGVLFDLRLAKRLNPLQQYAYRLLAASDEYTLPWSKRGTLQRQLSGRLLEDAKSGGRSVHELEERLITSADPANSAAVVKDALDRMAVDPNSEALLRDQQKEIERLRKVVAELMSADREFD